ncbi:hypothetical protein GIB67_030193 [Kingdonia uniflora]|uniref:Uncharacterized protein n=1 Tax=Kingdonia uniflora TaxID=39325 RepID=A0A7J7L0J3_9MAGN|nr:hypothetical protein GIB67_030193 [Kingdonia uniflora]
MTVVGTSSTNTEGIHICEDDVAGGNAGIDESEGGRDDIHSWALICRSSLMKKIVIDFGYGFLRRNCKGPIHAMSRWGWSTMFNMCSIVQWCYLHVMSMK